ncbi:TetR/AcrR family transcriptional regulator C-terminal domain-containing protein [Catenuloplanes atrovinosus]|uniref:TetR/AcrR family tetracycline transcriptional repressor n=1 Tax=Catenuloplanes atrovinosus TaxID=137266 RepID=A0AAE3YQS2_9ACTN|nr:TetR/AcrR family transcriptional regulator C-terminal domain-containing protein [Catenuloplanes atrovinosus]MDR7276932.1 TetR/AcrR family tetracycline transcriptional repressor [Catenuloplanes atrovinosus]
MTKSQADVVRAALEVLRDEGAAGVSLRAIAARLGVRMNTVVWHAKSKARLEELIADAIVAGVRLDDLPAGGRARAVEIARRYRHALLAHRDGAAIVAGTYAAEPATLDVAEALAAALLDAGLDEREAVWTLWAIVYFVLGLVQEEQALPARATGALDPGDRPALRRLLPALAEESFDARFEHGLALLLP